VSELRRELEDQLRAFLRNPAVVLEVQVPESDSDVVIVGMTNYEGVLRTRTETLAQALAYSNGLSRRANLGQIIVVRDDRAIVCDYYHYVEKDDARQNLAIRPGDLIVVTELYPPDAVPCAREWAAIESYFAGRLDRAALIRALDR
jgi:protein involved in polysaccharide export with SLBB domain